MTAFRRGSRLVAQVWIQSKQSYKEARPGPRACGVRSEREGHLETSCTPNRGPTQQLTKGSTWQKIMPEIPNASNWILFPLPNREMVRGGVPSILRHLFPLQTRSQHTHTLVAPQDLMGTKQATESGWTTEEAPEKHPELRRESPAPPSLPTG